MKKKLLTVLLLITISASTVACGGEEPGNSENPKQSEATAKLPAESSTPAPSNTAEPEKAESKQEDLDVELNMPADLVGEQTQEDLDAIAKEYGFESITLNEDGSATYKMTKKKYEELMADYREQVNSSLQELIGSENYPNFTKIETNDNFTEFTITTKSSELDLNEAFSTMAFFMYGSIYSVLSGGDTDNVSVTFINETTGEVISTSNSKDM